MSRPSPFSEISVSVKSVLESYFESWLQERMELRRKKNQEMYQLMLNALQTNPESDEDNTYLPLLWERLQVFYKDGIDWSQSGLYVAAENSDLISDWQKTFQQALKAFPRTIRIPLDDEFWKPASGDKRWVLFRKKLKRMRLGMAKIRVRFTNLFRKTPRQLPQTFRAFSFSKFAGHYASHPFARFIATEETAYLQLTREALDQIRQLTKEVGLALIFSAEDNRIWDQRDLEQIKQKTIELLQESRTLEDLDQPMQDFQSTTRERFQLWAETIFKQWQVNWNKAGSFSLSEKHFSLPSLRKRENLLNKEFTQQKLKWERFFNAEREDWQEEADLFVLLYKSGQEYQTIFAALQRYIEARLLPSFNAATETLTRSKDKFLSLDQKTADQQMMSFDTFQMERLTLVQEIKKRVLPAMMNPLINKAPNTLLSDYLGTIQTAVKRLPEKARVIRSRDLTAVPPKLDQEEIPVRNLFEKHLLIALQEGLEKTRDKLVETLESVLINISEIEQIVSFNLDTALSILQKDSTDQKAGQMTAEGLGRAVEKVTNLITTIRTAEETAQSEIHKLTYGFLVETQNLINNEKFIELSFRIARAQMKEGFKSFRKLFMIYTRKTIQIIVERGSKGIQIFRQQYTRLKTLAGFTTVTAVTDKKLQQFLIETWKTIESLPYIYQQLFRMEPLTEENFFFQREKELDRLREDFHLWLKGQYMVAAVIGERGAGKTTLMNLSESLVYSGYPVQWVSFERTTTEEIELIDRFTASFPDLKAKNLQELEQYLLQLEKPLVCVVKSIQFLFLKTIDGFDLLEKFLLLISKTARKVYWVVTCNTYSWEFLDKVIGIAQYFPGALTLSGMNTREVEEVIMKRHKVTGFKLFFETPAKLKTNRKFKKLNAETVQQAYLNSYFFQQLQDTADGNISVALLFWLKAIRQFETNRLVMYPQIDTDFAYLDQLSQVEMFTLGALIQHEILTPAQHAVIFLQGESKSELQLNTLSNKGVLFEVTKGAFKVNLSVYRPLVRLLKRKRILP